MGTTTDSAQRTNVKTNAREVEQKIPVSTYYVLYYKKKSQKVLNDKQQNVPVGIQRIKKMNFIKTGKGKT